MTYLRKKNKSKPFENYPTLFENYSQGVALDSPRKVKNRENLFSKSIPTRPSKTANLLFLLL